MGIRNCLILLYGLGCMTVKERKVKRDDKTEERKERGTERGWKGRREKIGEEALKEKKKKEREIRGGRLRQRVPNLVAYNIIPSSGTMPKTATRCSKYCREGFLGVGAVENCLFKHVGK